MPAKLSGSGRSLSDDGEDCGEIAPYHRYTCGRPYDVVNLEDHHHFINGDKFFKGLKRTLQTTDIIFAGILGIEVLYTSARRSR